MDRHTLLLWLARHYPAWPGKSALLHRGLHSGAAEIRLFRNNAGQRQLLWLDNWIDRVTYANGAWERRLTAAFSHWASELACQVFIDIGAGAGSYTLALSRLPKINRIMAFEPDPVNYAQLCANLWLNRLSDLVEHHRIALSSYHGEQDLFLARKRDAREGAAFNTGTSALDFEPLRHGQGTTRQVPVRRLDDILTLGDEPVAIKIDTEGHEYSVLAGMRKLLTERVGVVLIEVFPDNMTKVGNLLAENGFRLADNPAHWNYLFVKERVHAKKGAPDAVSGQR